MNPRAGVVRLLIELLQIAGEPDQIIPVGNAVQEAAEQRRDRIVLDRLEDQLRGGRGPRPTPAALPAPRTAVATCVPWPESTSAAPSSTIVSKQKSGVPGRLRMVRTRVAAMSTCAPSATPVPSPVSATATIVRRPVIAAVVGDAAAEDDAAAELVVLHPEDERLDAGHARHRDQRGGLIAPGRDGETAAPERDPHALGGERGADLIQVGVAIQTDHERPLTIVGRRSGELGGGLVPNERRHERQRPNARNLLRAEPGSEREPRHVFQQRGAGFGHRPLPRLLHRALELQRVLPVRGRRPPHLRLCGDYR